MLFDQLRPETSSLHGFAPMLLIAAIIAVAAVPYPASGALGAVSTPGEQSAEGSILTDSCEVYQVSAGDMPSLQIVNALGALRVHARRGRLDLSLGGVVVPDDRLRRQGPLVEILSDDGETMFVFAYFPRRGPGADGQLIYSPTFDPASAERLLGMTFADVSEEVATVAGTSQSETIKVARVCAEGSARAARLVPGSLLRSIESMSPFGVAELTGILEPGQEVQLRVATPRPGRPVAWETAVLVVGDIGEWPPAATMRSTFEDVIGS